LPSPPLHRHHDAALGGHLGSPVVAGVDVPDHTHCRVVGEHPLDLPGGEPGAVADDDLAGLYAMPKNRSDEDVGVEKSRLAPPSLERLPGRFEDADAYTYMVTSNCACRRPD
jgi:hypothetical protein